MLAGGRSPGRLGEALRVSAPGGRVRVFIGGGSPEGVGRSPREGGGSRVWGRVRTHAIIGALGKVAGVEGVL